MNINVENVKDIQDFDKGATVKDLMIALMQVKDKNLPVFIENNNPEGDCSVQVDYIAETTDMFIIGGF